MRNAYSMRGRLFASTLLSGAVTMGAVAAVAIAPGQAFAQAAPAASDQAAASKGGQATQVQEVVVTGSILRHKNLETDAPLTVVSQVDLQNRGITTINDAVQTLAGNNSGALPNNFGGAFASGASGASLRGLSTDSTLVLVDGLRMAYYPLSDDGSRNFVDLNTIPDVIVDRVEVLQEGASSTYGADAIAGVINIITKKNFQGFQGQAEEGFAQHGGAGHTMGNFLIGRGDLDKDGWNFYLGAEYQKDEALWSRERGRLYSTDDQSYDCGKDAGGNKVCRANNIINGLQFDNSFGGVGNDIVPVVRPVDASGSYVGDFQLLNPGAGCGKLKSVTVTPAQAAVNSVGGFSAPVTLCQQDLTHDYGEISPERDRYSINMRFTKKLWEGAEGYLEANYYNTEVQSISSPEYINRKSPPGPSGTQINGQTFYLPVYVCPTGVGCNATNGTLNPNDPFAAQGQRAQLFYTFGDEPRRSDLTNQVFRVAGGFHGVVGDDWRYNVDAVAMSDQMNWTRTGYISVLGVQQAINTGVYNFVNPSLNTAGVRNLVSPNDTINPHTYETEVDANLSKGLWQLPGGQSQLGVGLSYRSEGLYDPTANPETPYGYTSFFRANAFAAAGSRTVESAYYELDLPVLKGIDVNTGGRYDNYSTGASDFSPKVQAKYKVTPWLTLRGSWSEGFRIPSFAETGAAPTTGYVKYTDLPATFVAAHGNDLYGETVGSVSIANPNLKPETSTNFTAGFVLQPIHNLAFTVDYYRIEKKNVITGASCFSQALANYYTSGAMSTGSCNIRLGIPDPNHPGAPISADYVTVPFVNADSEVVDGIDFSASYRHDLLGYAKWTSVLNGTYLHEFDQTDGGDVWHFAGTQGPNNPTAGSGSPRWRMNWQNTFDFGKFGLTATVYYTSGMKAVAPDAGSSGSCGVGNFTPGDSYDYGVAGSDPTNTPLLCRTSSFTDVDLHARYDLNPHWQIYADIQNLLDADPPFDPTSYAALDYQPAWGSQGILGRYFKVGVKAKF